VTAHDPNEACRVVIVGMMGSGKTTVGKLLAEATGWARYDNDQLLDSLYGMTPKQLVEARGKTQMREAEDAALAVGLKADPPFILDAAAGTVLSAASLEALRGPIVIWLKASPETLLNRAVGGAHRPWLDGGEGWIRAAAAERQALYASVADIEVETDDRSPALVVQEILSRLRGLCPALKRQVGQ